MRGGFLHSFYHEAHFLACPSEGPKKFWKGPKWHLIFFHGPIMASLMLGPFWTGPKDDIALHTFTF